MYWFKTYSVLIYGSLPAQDVLWIYDDPDRKYWRTAIWNVFWFLTVWCDNVFCSIYVFQHKHKDPPSGCPFKQVLSVPVAAKGTFISALIKGWWSASFSSWHRKPYFFLKTEIRFSDIFHSTDSVQAELIILKCLTAECRTCIYLSSGEEAQ